MEDHLESKLIWTEVDRDVLEAFIYVFFRYPKLDAVNVEVQSIA